ncbi:MAG: hypothetical protein JSS76_07460 [Bacteroidetes bacterium]|nr:hypothetical protein [Bacteroidota bacterium]
MKVLIISFVLISTLMTYAQGGQIASWQRRSAVRVDYDASYYTAPDYTASACERYKGMKTCGIVLTAIGGGLMATGIGIVVASNSGHIYGGAENRYFRGTTPLVAGGAAALAISSLSLSAGIPLTVFGQMKQKRVCSHATVRDF